MTGIVKHGPRAFSRTIERRIISLVFPTTLAAISVVVSSNAIAQSPEVSAPVIRIKSPFAGAIWRLDVDRSENIAVLSNAYKTVNLWRLNDPSVPTFLRTPLRQDQQKRAHAVAISPDGDLVAYSVPPTAQPSGVVNFGTSAIYIVVRDTGRIVKIINDVPTRPQVLRFSPDGAYLAAGLTSGCGLRIWSAHDWSLFAEDAKGYGGGDMVEDRCCREGGGSDCENLPQTNAVQFLPQGSRGPWLITSSDTGVRAYQRTGSGVEVIANANPSDIGLERPGGVAVSPDGYTLAVGDRRNRGIPAPQPDPDIIRLRVALLDIGTLKPKRAPLEIGESALFHLSYLDRKQNISINQASLDRVAWLRAGDQEYIVAGGAFPCEAARPELRPLADPSIRQEQCLVRWTVDHENKDPLFIPAGTDRTIDLVGLQRRAGILYASHRQVAAINPDGNALDLAENKILLSRNPAADFRDGSMDFRISSDAKVVTFADYRTSGGAPTTLTFDLRKPEILQGNANGLVTIAPDQNANLISEWKDGERTPPILNEERLSGSEFHQSEVYRSAALLQSKRIALIGSSEFLRIVSYAGDKPRVLCQEPIREEAYRVNLTADGAMAVAGHSDGTLRWYRIHSREERCQFELLLSVYLVETSPGEWAWAAWRPSGIFANHPSAKGLLEWQFTDTNGQESVVPFKKLIQWYNEEEIRRALAGAAGDKSEGEVQGAQKPDAGVIEAAGQRSILHILKEPENRETAAETVRFRVVIEDVLAWPKELDVRMGEANAPVAKSFQGKDFSPQTPIKLEKSALDEGVVDFSITLPLSARRHNRSIQICFYLDKVLQTCHMMDWIGKLAEPQKRRLWAVFIGISKHDAPALNLNFAGNDAIDMARLFVRDYENRVELKKSSIPPDFSEIHVDLIVSPLSRITESELKALEQHAYVKRRLPTRNGVVAALEDIVKRAEIEDLSDDVLLFYFSGHGVIHPEPRNKGRTVFVMPATSATFSSENLDRTALTSDKLLDLLRRIPGQKVVFLDACRTPSAIASAKPINAGLAAEEFNDTALLADFFFSGLYGQRSVERQEFAFDNSRPLQQRGNSLFAYAVLDILAQPRLPDPRRKGYKPSIDADDLAWWVKSFFDLTDRKSPARQFQRRLRLKDVQTPTVVRYNSEPPKPVLRTYETQR